MKTSPLIISALVLSRFMHDIGRNIKSSNTSLSKINDDKDHKNSYTTQSQDPIFIPELNKYIQISMYDSTKNKLKILQEDKKTVTLAKSVISNIGTDKLYECITELLKHISTKIDAGNLNEIADKLTKDMINNLQCNSVDDLLYSVVKYCDNYLNISNLTQENEPPVTVINQNIPKKINGDTANY